MQTSSRGIDLIARFEGLRLGAYPDPGTGGKPWTIGYGTTRINGQPVQPDDIITEAQAAEYLRADVSRFERDVSALVQVPVNQHEFDALVSLAYNIGTGALSRSTLLRKLNDGDRQGAADEFQRWIHAGGRRMDGLVRRRNAERDLFLEPMPEQPAPGKPLHWYDEVDARRS